MLKRLAHLFNPIAVTVAGSRFLPFWSLVRHRGRRSGRTYSTPVAARRTVDGFAIPLAFGERADWCRNVLASGSCVVRFGGSDYATVDPVVVDAESGSAAFRSFERFALRLARISRILLVRTA